MSEQMKHDEPNAAIPAGMQPAAADDYAAKYKKLLTQLAPRDREEVLAALPANISDEARYHIVRSRVTGIRSRDRARVREVMRREVGLDRITVQVPKALRPAFERMFEEFKAINAGSWPKIERK